MQADESNYLLTGKRTRWNANMKVNHKMSTVKKKMKSIILNQSNV